MSINMTQEFCFESDELTSVMSMFSAVARILYNMNDYTRPVIMLEQPSMWEDGRYNWDWRRSLETYIYENAGGSSVLVPCATYGGATVLKQHAHYKKKDKAAEVACSLHQEPKPTRMWIATVCYGKWVDPKKKIYRPKGWDDLTSQLQEIAAAVDKKAFLEKFQEFEDRSFDGHVNMGYRLQWRPDGGQDTLDLSGIHANYGK